MVAVLPETTATATSITVTAQRPQAASQTQPSFFHRLLSELNPLQYVPVVGTIYRAMTDDTIPETARFAGSLVVSGLTGGPVGLAINLGTTALEKLTGIDPETIGSHLLADIGIGSHTQAATSPAKPATAHVQPASATKPAAAPPSLDAGSATAWSTAQLAAYGVKQDSTGTLSRGAVSGADVLNNLELARLAQARSGKTLADIA
jgi:hypothetical protein